MSVLRDFGDFFGLRLNFKNTVAIVRNHDSGPWLDALQQQGISLRNWVRCLGTRQGNVPIASARRPTDWGITVDQAFAQAQHECLCRAEIVLCLPLQLIERLFPLEIWILPVLVPCEGILPDKFGHLTSLNQSMGLLCACTVGAVFSDSVEATMSGVFGLAPPACPNVPTTVKPLGFQLPHSWMCGYQLRSPLHQLLPAKPETPSKVRIVSPCHQLKGLQHTA